MSDEQETPKTASQPKSAERPAAANGQNGAADHKRAAEPAPDTAGDGDIADEFLAAETADVGADPMAVLTAQVETLQSQIEDLTSRLLRAHADLDNLRKRGEREKQETARYAISKFARDTVEVADNFERAMQSVPVGAIEENPQLKALLDGVTMTEREFLNVLERHGVKRVSPKGEAFNPHLHQAVMERQDASVANGTVVEVFQAGYMIEDRCLRPAMVVVARGGGKTPKPAPAASEQPVASEKPQSNGGSDASSDNGNGGI